MKYTPEMTRALDNLVDAARSVGLAFTDKDHLTSRQHNAIFNLRSFLDEVECIDTDQRLAELKADRERNR